MVDPGAPRPAGIRRVSFTLWSLVALALGLGLGYLLHGRTEPWVARLSDGIAPLGAVWVKALRLVVVPLVITRLLVALTGARDGARIGALGAKALALFVTVVVAGGAYAMIVAPPLIGLYPANAATASALRAGTLIPEAALRVAAPGAGTFGAWLIGLVPQSLPHALDGTEILPALLCSIAFGLAVRGLPTEERQPLTQLIRAMGGVMMTIVEWVLFLTPVGVFSLAFQLTLHAGGQVTGMLLVFVLLSSGMLLGFTALFYPLTMLVGRVSVGKFARAVAPAQLIAATTRSSIAALPALLEGARDVLRLPDSTTGFVLPFSNAIFKANRTVSGMLKLLFLAHVFGISLSAPQIANYFLATVVVSFSTVGIPGGSGGFSLLPALLAVGIPIEGAVLVQAVDTIPDIFKTITNVTGDMSAAVLLSPRASRPTPG